MPNKDGQKFSKSEALAWTYLFAIEDLWVLVKDELKDQNVDMEVVENFKLNVAEKMYKIAINPSDNLAEERDFLMKNACKLLNVNPSRAFNEKLSYHFED